MISLIIPVYNGEKYIRRCLDSILGQDYFDFELIIIDDGSIDNSAEEIRCYENRFKNFKFISKNNEGQASARNLGIKISRGEYICFVDIDDTVKSDYLTVLASLISTGTDLGVSQIKRIFEYKPSILEKKFGYIQDVYYKNSMFVDENKTLLTEIRNAPYAKIFRRDFIIQNNITFLEGKLYEDLYFNIAVLANNPKISFSANSSYNYYVHHSSSMTRKDVRIYDMFGVFEEVIVYLNKRMLFNEFSQEIEYLAIYHICIGTMFRLFKMNPLKFFKYRKECFIWMKLHGFSIHSNDYVKKLGLITRIYLLVFFIKLRRTV